MIVGNGIAADRFQCNSPVAYEIRTLNAANRAAVDELQVEIAQLLGERYIPASAERIEVMLQQGMSLGVFVGGKLEGLRLVYDKRPLTEQLKSALRLSPAEERDVAQLSGVYVRERFLGNRLGFTMTRIAIESLRAIYRKHIFATVAPENVASLKNLAELGFVVRSSLTLAGGAERLVLHCRP